MPKSPWRAPEKTDGVAFMPVLGSSNINLGSSSQRNSTSVAIFQVNSNYVLGCDNTAQRAVSMRSDFLSCHRLRASVVESMGKF